MRLSVNYFALGTGEVNPNGLAISLDFLLARIEGTEKLKRKVILHKRVEFLGS